MDVNELIETGNSFRDTNPAESLKYYAQAFITDPDCMAAWNNYGNVIREMGHPERAIPFLQQAVVLNPNYVTAHFNLAVCYLMMGRYSEGWPLYEVREHYEHLAGTFPKFDQPRWRGEDLHGKVIYVMGEQGHGDNIQFVRFIRRLEQLGAQIKLSTTSGLISLFQFNFPNIQLLNYNDPLGHFDYWSPIMSLPLGLQVTLENLAKDLQYLGPRKIKENEWRKFLGPKHKTRIGIQWSGRRDAWLNQHKGMSLETMSHLIIKFPDCEWINLQIDSEPYENNLLNSLNVKQYPGTIRCFEDTAALIANLDLVITVDTAIAHLAGSLGRPTWICLPKFAVDWRWQQKRKDCAWYPSARLFRQENFHDWSNVLANLEFNLIKFKV